MTNVALLDDVPVLLNDQTHTGYHLFPNRIGNDCRKSREQVERDINLIAERGLGFA